MCRQMQLFHVVALNQEVFSLNTQTVLAFVPKETISNHCNKVQIKNRNLNLYCCFIGRIDEHYYS